MKYKITALFEEHIITGINFDSKKIKKGEAFFAIKGSKFDGNEYIEDALKAGASLIFSDSKSHKDNTSIVYVEDASAALIIAAEIFYPKTPENLIAVTGTNGKTSVVSYCQQLFALLDKESASLGTIGLVCSNKSITTKFNADQYKALTSADILTFRQILNYLAENNINNLAFEASSHGIDQQRLGNLQVQAAAFTNFSQDHLDYHETMGNYLNAKLKLFTSHLVKEGIAIISSEISEINYIKKFFNKSNINYLTVGTTGKMKIYSADQLMTGQNLAFSYEGKDYNFQTEIIGSFQASNLLIAAALVHRFNIASMDEIIEKIPLVKAVKGRLERITQIDDHFHVFVDYSHTPESLEKALIELKKIKPARGKLIVVFGCGGNRDVGKRPLMGEVSKHADIQIVTNDNPRFEDSSIIRKQILAAVPQAKEIGDRTLAITTAVNMLEHGDILLIAGKGHEDYQIIGDAKIPLDDSKIARSALESKV
jgi:UDP-N-acetylmuramoyl-L-alanyl-D-glutamate--2,6-diaminopimelate ligase